MAEVLSKSGGERYKHLTEEGIIRGLSDGLSGRPYDLLQDAFFTGEKNLWKDVLVGVLNNAGLEDAWANVQENRTVLRWQTGDLADQATLESELTLFVQYRNEAAHGSLSEVIGLQRLMGFVNLVRVLAGALSEAAAGAVLDRRRQLATVELLGTVIHEWSDNVVGVSAMPVTLAQGEHITVHDRGSSYEVVVQSLEVDKVPVDQLDCPEGLKVGMKLSRSARLGAELLREKNVLSQTGKDGPVKVEPSD